jgi:hypothetical protein
MHLARVTAIALVTVFGQVDVAGAGSAGRCGGTGGNNHRVLTCPDGHYVAAIGARGRSFVDEFSIACRRIPVSGQPGSLGSYKSAGSGGGTGGDSGECDKGHAVKTIMFRSGFFVDNVIAVSCGSRSGDGWTSDTQSSFDIEIGGIGGQICTIECQSNEALYKVTVRYGAWVDSVRAECRK